MGGQGQANFLGLACRQRAHGQPQPALAFASCLSLPVARSLHPALMLARPPPHPPLLLRAPAAVAYSGLFTHANYFEESPLYVYAMKASRSPSQGPSALRWSDWLAGL